MPLFALEQGAKRRLNSWRGVVISLACLALVISLASRTFHSPIYLARTAHSQFEGAKIQHRDRDAAGWVPPTLGLFLRWAVMASDPVEPAEKDYLRPHQPSLYNRPPPLA